MKLSSSFFKRRYSEMRMGHGGFFAVLLQLSNFILIGYALFVAEVLPGIEIWQFIILFLAIYLPTAIFLGRWYRKHQQPIDRKLRLESIEDDEPKNTLLLDFMEYYLQDKTDERAAELREKIRKQRG